MKPASLRTNAVPAVLFVALLMLMSLLNLPSILLKPLNTVTTRVAAWQLELSGRQSRAAENRLTLEGTEIRVHSECSGALAMAMYLLGALLLPPQSLQKAILAASGVVFLFLFNTVRVALLSILIQDQSTSSEWWHYYGFPILIIGVILCLWTIQTLIYRRSGAKRQPPFRPE